MSLKMTNDDEDDDNVQMILPEELEAGPIDLPLVPRVVRQTVRGRLLDLAKQVYTRLPT